MARKVTELVSAGIAQKMSLEGGEGFHMHPPADETRNGFMTVEDRLFLNTIEEGAQKNQNAFSQFNNVTAKNPTDTLNLVDGIGIKISTNPTDNKITITATGEATPGAHGSSHNHDGSDPIPELVAVTEQLEDILINVEKFPIQVPESDDTSRIQRAIDFAPSGSKIGFANKTYIVTSLTVAKSLQFVGMGLAIVKYKDGLSASTQLFDITKNGIDITFENIIFNGNKDNLTQPDGSNLLSYRIIQWRHSQNTVVDAKSFLTVSKCKFLNVTTNALYLQGYKETTNNVTSKRFFVTVKDNYFEKGFESYAGHVETAIIISSGNTDINIYSNRFIKGETITLRGLSAITITTEDTTQEVPTSATITKNYFEGYGRQPMGSLGGIGVVEFYASGERLIIKENKFVNSYNAAIRGKTNSKNVIIHNNIIDGIYTDANTTERTYGIAINRGTFFGIYSSYQITNNIIRNVVGTGIVVSGATSSNTPSGKAKNIIITGNICDIITTSGINAYGVQCLYFENAIIKNNEISGAYNGVHITDCKFNAIIEGNQVYNATNGMVYVQGYIAGESGYTDYDANVIVGRNTLRTTVDTGFTTFRVVYAESIRNLIVTENTAHFSGSTAPQNFLRTGNNVKEIVKAHNNILCGVAAGTYFAVTSGTLDKAGNYNATVAVS